MSTAVLNICECFVGIVVFASIIQVATFPIVVIFKFSGVTSRSKIPVCSPARIDPWIAAPSATASGLTDLFPSLPKYFLISSWIRGIRVEPPTKRISSISVGFRFAAARASFATFIALATNPEIILLKVALFKEQLRCWGTLSTTVI